MSTKTEWEIKVDTQGWIYSVPVSISATVEGLKVGEAIIPWVEIDAARESLAPGMQNWGAGITTQPAYQAEQESRNQKMRDMLKIIKISVDKPKKDANI